MPNCLEAIVVDLAGRPIRSREVCLTLWHSFAFGLALVSQTGAGGRAEAASCENSHKFRSDQLYMRHSKISDSAWSLPLYFKRGSLQEMQFMFMLPQGRKQCA